MGRIPGGEVEGGEFESGRRQSEKAHFWSCAKLLLFSVCALTSRVLIAGSCAIYQSEALVETNTMIPGWLLRARPLRRTVTTKFERNSNCSRSKIGIASSNRWELS